MIDVGGLRALWVEPSLGSWFMTVNPSIWEIEAGLKSSRPRWVTQKHTYTGIGVRQTTYGTLHFLRVIIYSNEDQKLVLL
ncbi:hypothetical protein ACQP3J_27865, partial [Escherichia coli]